VIILPLHLFTFLQDGLDNADFKLNEPLPQKCDTCNSATREPCTKVHIQKEIYRNTPSPSPPPLPPNQTLEGIQEHICGELYCIVIRHFGFCDLFILWSLLLNVLRRKSFNKDTKRDTILHQLITESTRILRRVW
jgi:hypothetical protein